MRNKAFLNALFLISISCLIWAISAANVSAQDRPELLLHNFDDGEMTNALGGGSGAWVLDPGDPDQFCYVTLESENPLGEKGFSIKLNYDLESTERAQGGFWTQLLGKDLRDFDHLNFFVRGDPKLGFATQFRIEFKKSQNTGTSEKMVGSFLVEGVTDSWQEVSIPLNKMVGMTDWSGIEEMVIVLKDRLEDVKKGVLYFDKFRVIKTGEPGPSMHDPVPKKIEKESDNKTGLQRAEMLSARLIGFPKQVNLKKKFSDDSNEFLKEIAKDTWGYFRDIVDKEHALPLDNIMLSKDAVLGANSVVGDYTNVTNIGLYLLCVVAARDFEFIDEKEALDRISKVLDTIEKLETYKGFLYNYYDTTSTERTSDFISFVDEGWLTIGLIIVKNAYPQQFKERCDKLINSRDFSFFYDAVEGQMYHGYHTNVGVHSEYHYGAFYTEPRAISYMSIGRGQAPDEHWFMMARTFPSEYDWQTQSPINRNKKNVMGYNFYGGYYQYKGKEYVPSWGGSLFEALMPTLIIDEKGLAPKGLGLNDLRHVQVQILYAKDELGYPVWGMSPCSVPPGNAYSEYGASVLGLKGYPQGVVTPHVSFLSLEFEPEEVVRNLRKMIELYPIYGEYGFYDSVDVKTGEVSVKYLCLDQAMCLISLDNYLNHGAIRKRFMGDAIAQKSIKLLSEEKFFENEGER